ENARVWSPCGSGRSRSRLVGRQSLVAFRAFPGDTVEVIQASSQRLRSLGMRRAGRSSTEPCLPRRDALRRYIMPRILIVSATFFLLALTATVQAQGPEAKARAMGAWDTGQPSATPLAPAAL